MKKSISIAILLLVTALVFTACQQPAPTPDPDEQQPGDDLLQWAVTFVKADGSTVELTHADDLELVGIEATKARKDGTEETQQWKGVALSAALDYLELTAFEGVTAESADGYSVDLDKEMVTDEGTIIGLELNGEPLPADDGPAQLVVASQRSNFWIKQLSKITLK